MTKVSENQESNNANTLLATGFQPIKNLNLKRKNSKVIVTNNITATDANGQMSHIWIVGLVQKSKGEYIAFTDSGMKIHNITHFCELPQLVANDTQIYLGFLFNIYSKII